jgi:hypothetical protein
MGVGHWDDSENKSDHPEKMKSPVAMADEAGAKRFSVLIG